MAKFDEKYFNDGLHEEYDVKNLLADGEAILWQGTPDRKAFVLGSVFKMMPVALLWLAIDGTIIYFIVSGGVLNEMGWFAFALIGFFAIHLLPVWIWIGNIVNAGTRQKNTQYVFTNKRIVIKTGFIGINVTNIYYQEISTVNLRVGIIDKWCHVGDIYISTGFGSTRSNMTSQVLWDVKDPYVLTAKLQNIVNDIKTDMAFPNDLRPDSNSGYNVKYKN